MKHTQADLIKAWADDTDTVFTCKEYPFKCEFVFMYNNPECNWSIYKPKTVTKWLWAKPNGMITQHLYASNAGIGEYYIKLEWSATEFEV